MACRFGRPLSDEILYALVDDEADDASLRHSVECPYCARRLAELRASESWIRKMMHPPGQQIMEYAEGLLPDAMISTITNHIENCPVCLADVARFRSMPVPDLDEEWSPQPISVRPHSVAQPSLWQEIGAVVAQLVNPSPNMIPVYGESERQVRYAAEGLDIRLIFTRDNGRLMVEGIIAGDNLGWEDVLITLRFSDGTEFTTQTGDYTFAFDDVPEGQADLVLQAAESGRMIGIESLDINGG